MAVILKENLDGPHFVIECTECNQKLLINVEYCPENEDLDDYKEFRRATEASRHDCNLPWCG